VKLLSKRLGVPKSAIVIAGGETARHKRIALPMDEVEVRRVLAGN